MQFFLPIPIPALQPRISYEHKIYLFGSCFTEHIFHFLQRHKFQAMQNSHGIMFNPVSVCKALQDIVEGKMYQKKDLFYLNEYWHSWYHHSDFSSMNAEVCLEKINTTILQHQAFLKDADYLFITLGSAFAYYLVEANHYVGNNHRAPSQWFRKDLLEINEITRLLKETQEQLLKFNPKLKLVFTISPVRHIRDGVIENNRSKARLIESVHSLENVYYFPAYEIVMDVLRDYRFFDSDMVHPNYQATQFVWEKWVEHCLDSKVKEWMHEMAQLYKARHHKPRDMGSSAHKNFMLQHKQLCEKLRGIFPDLDFAEELNYFSNGEN